MLALTDNNKNAGCRATLLAFLERIGLHDEAEALIAREPNAEDLDTCSAPSC